MNVKNNHWIITFVLTILCNNLLAIARLFLLSGKSCPSGCRNQSVAAVVFAGLLMYGLPAAAELDRALTAAGWSEFTFEGKPANQFLQQADSPDVIQIDTDKSVSIAYLAFSARPVNLKRTPYLTFSWRRLGLAVDADLTRKGGDDRTLAVYVAFSWQPERASLKERLLRPFVESREGPAAPGRVLTYLWGGGAGRGVWFENPYTGKAGWMQILQLPSDPVRQWFSHQIDVRSDFIDRFGYPPPAPSYIAIAADSDDTNTAFSAQVRGLGFSG